MPWCWYLRLSSKIIKYINISTYSVTVFLGNGDGIFVRPLFEQSTTTPDEEHEHSAGQSLASLPLPALTNNFVFELVENTTIHKHNPKIALIFISQISFSFGFIVIVFAHICLMS